MRNFLIFIALLAFTPLQAQITLDIDMDYVKGSATQHLYGISAFRGSAPHIANNSDYQDRMNDLNSSFVRFHASNHNKCDHVSSWINCDTETWDEAAIIGSLEEFQVSGDGMMLTVFNYPPWKLNGNKKPTNLDINYYAQWCAELVHIVNVKNGFNVKYWEPFNEWDGKGYSGVEMAQHYDACYNAMKAVDPTIEMCGPVTRNSSDQTIVPFLQNITTPLDLFSYHEYGGGATGSRTGVYNRTGKLRSGARNVRNKLNNNGFANVPSFIGEWNIVWSWNASGWEYQVNEVGGVYDALSIKYLVEDGDANNVLALTAWEDAGGNYGKIKKDFTGLNPAGHVLSTFNNHAVGDAVSTVSSASDQVEGFTVVRADGSAMIAVMNHGVSGTKSVQIDANGWTPSDPSNITKYVISGSGKATSTVSWSSITNNSFSIDEDNVIIFVTGEVTQVDPTGVTIDNCPIASVNIDETYVLEATVEPFNAWNKNVTWSSSNTAVATVNSSGVVTPVSLGITTITVTSEVGNFTATCDIEIVPSACDNPLPNGWSSQDIGAVAISGCSGENNGTFTIKASGSDIYGTIDEFHYINQPLSGDGEITARVASLNFTNQYAKAAVMIRENLSADAKHAMTALSASSSKSAQFQYRSAIGGETSSINGPNTGQPYWVKLTRAGDIFTSSISTDGNSWVEIGTDTIPMNNNVYIGLASTSHNNSELTKAVFDNVSLGNNPPDPTYLLTVNNGSGGGSYTAGTIVNISADAPNSCQEFAQWAGNVAYVNDINSATTTFTMPASAASVTATYNDLSPVTLTLTDATASNAACSQGYLPNETVTLTAYPAPTGYQFKEWAGDTGGIADVNNPSTNLTIGNTNLSIQATYEEIPTSGDLPWNEDFTLADGTTTDNGPTSWSSTRGGGTFSVQSNQFEVNGSGGEGVWTSQQIDISGNTVDLSIDINGAGSLDNGGQYGDYLQIYTKINGGSEVLQHNTQGSVSNQTVNINGLSGNSLEIVIRSLTTASDEFYYFDNVDVQSSGGGGTIPVSGVAIDNCPSGNITEGNTHNLNETVSPSNATNQSVSWSSSNTSVATVNASGLVSAVAAGSATITVTTTDGNFTDNCAITVTSSGGGGFSGFYYIRNRANGNNLRLGSSGATVNTSGSTDDNAQWELVNITGDEYYLENKGIGQWAHGRSDGKIKGTSSQSGNDRKWEITPNGSYYQLKNVQRNNFIGLNSSGWVRLQSTTETDTDWELISVGASSRIAAVLPNSKTEDQMVSLYPNPATDLINISLPASINGSVKVDAFDLTGKLVLSQQLDAGGPLQVSTENLNKGLYLINISAAGLNFKQKLLIE